MAAQQPPVAKVTGVSLHYGKAVGLDQVSLTLPANCMDAPTTLAGAVR